MIMNITKMMFISLLLLLSFAKVGWCGGNSENTSPEAIMLEYFKAMKANDFSSMYDMVSDNMKDDRTREQYVADWENVIKLGQVEIIDSGITSTEINGDKARVNVWSKASDVFNVFGIIEKEIDHLIFVDGVWKLDVTEVLMEEVTEIPTE
jgi:hypothetical protein